MKNKTNIFAFIALVVALFSACDKDKFEPKSIGNYADTNYVDFHLGSLNSYEDCIYPYKVMALTVHNDSATAYRWLDNGSNPTLRYITNEGSYDVEVTYLSSSRDTFEFYILSCNPRVYTPTSFTPNYDGINDIWRPVSNYIETIHWEIRTEDGIKIFETNDLQEAWDGDFPDGYTAPSGYYMYYINYSTLTETNIILTGHLELYR